MNSTHKKSRRPAGKQEGFLPSELQSKLRKAKLELEQVYEYKAILREDGMEPDDHDKERESRLVNRIRQLEKQLSGRWVKDEDYRGPSKPARRPALKKAQKGPIRTSK